MSRRFQFDKFVAGSYAATFFTRRKRAVRHFKTFPKKIYIIFCSLNIFLLAGIENYSSENRLDLESYCFVHRFPKILERWIFFRLTNFSFANANYRKTFKTIIEFAETLNLSIENNFLINKFYFIKIIFCFSLVRCRCQIDRLHGIPWKFTSKHGIYIFKHKIYMSSINIRLSLEVNSVRFVAFPAVQTCLTSYLSKLSWTLNDFQFSIVALLANARSLQNGIFAHSLDLSRTKNEILWNVDLFRRE